MNDRNQQLVDGLKRLIEEIESGGQDVLYCEEYCALSGFGDTPRMALATHLGMADRPMRRIVIYLMATDEWFQKARAETRILFGGLIELSGSAQLEKVSQETLNTVRQAEVDAGEREESVDKSEDDT